MKQEPPQHFEQKRHRVSVTLGQFRVSGDPEIELAVVLGSCVAACLFDPVARVGGVNHFLLALPPVGQMSSQDQGQFGEFLMDWLVQGMLSKGALRQNLRARLYGGANPHFLAQQIGTLNADFAHRFLIQERIRIVGEDLGGGGARNVIFCPTTGQVRCRTIALQPKFGEAAQ